MQQLRWLCLLVQLAQYLACCTAAVGSVLLAILGLLQRIYLEGACTVLTA